MFLPDLLVEVTFETLDFLEAAEPFPPRPLPLVDVVLFLPLPVPLDSTTDDSGSSSSTIGVKVCLFGADIVEAFFCDYAFLLVIDLFGLGSYSNVTFFSSTAFDLIDYDLLVVLLEPRSSSIFNCWISLVFSSTDPSSLSVFLLLDVLETLEGAMDDFLPLPRFGRSIIFALET